MSRISLTGAARKDLQGIYDFIADDNIAAAHTDKTAASDSVCFSTSHASARNDIRPGMRSITEGNYAIFYRIVDSGIQIIRVLHTSMDAVRAFEQMQD